jgi:hypothetical protein
MKRTNPCFDVFSVDCRKRKKPSPPDQDLVGDSQVLESTEPLNTTPRNMEVDSLVSLLCSGLEFLKNLVRCKFGATTMSETQSAPPLPPQNSTILQSDELDPMPLQEEGLGSLLVDNTNTIASNEYSENILSQPTNNNTEYDELLANMLLCGSVCLDMRYTFSRKHTHNEQVKQRLRVRCSAVLRKIRDLVAYDTRSYVNPKNTTECWKIHTPIRVKDLYAKISEQIDLIREYSIPFDLECYFGPCKANKYIQMTF